VKEIKITRIASHKIRKNLITIYNKYARKRAAYQKQNWKKRERKEFLYYLKWEKKTTILEIGAGTGLDSLFFKRYGFKVTTTDISTKQIKICKERGLPAHVLDIYEIHKLKKKFDAIYAFNCLLHIPKADLENILKKIKKVLNENGLLYIGVYGGTDFEGILEEDKFEPKRFFSFYHTNKILKIVQKYFKLEYFRHIAPFKDGGTFQSMILRKV